ncbi:hypothetical protein [Pedobacter sp. MC2016-24]|uniref:hypothetical protein n=1 Tax=Pedobacter sp. MC2016-24 TaxID=2780090 RepID=UPI001882F769|nr:hypothetical protein [Pedobacter sp. MC2016-24]MBE9601254.1 hypothetical protein [Pedobacter sp. MC2016-24]
MKKTTLVLALLAITFAFKANAQETVAQPTTRAQNVYVELAGQGIILTANYDTRFSNKRNGIGGRIGIGYLAIDGDKITSIPVGLNYLLGKGKSFFEIGLGMTYLSAKGSDDSFLFDDETADGLLGTMNFGYRLQPVDSGFSLRAGLTPIFNSNNFLPFYGVSLGYTF